jgi:hypothetical protein
MRLLMKHGCKDRTKMRKEIDVKDHQAKKYRASQLAYAIWRNRKSASNKESAFGIKRHRVK